MRSFIAHGATLVVDDDAMHGTILTEKRKSARLLFYFLFNLGQMNASAHCIYDFSCLLVSLRKVQPLCWLLRLAGIASTVVISK